MQTYACSSAAQGYCAGEGEAVAVEAMRASLLRLEGEWEAVQASHDRLFTVIWLPFLNWSCGGSGRGKAANRAGRALHLRGYSSAREPEPFAAVILCTADHDKVDDRTRSKWSRALRYAAEYKDLDESLRDFMKRKGGINRCASRFSPALGHIAPGSQSPSPQTGG
jgi:hypothetical protein